MNQTLRRFLPPIVLALGMNLGLLMLYYIGAPKLLIGDESYYFHRASELAAAELPRYVPLWPVLYSDVVGHLFGLFGVHRLPIQALQIVMWLLTAVLYADIAKRILHSTVASYATLVLLLFSAELMAFSHFLWPETPHLFLFALTLWILIRFGDDWLMMILAGTSLALAMLLKLLLLPFLPILVLFLVFWGNASWSRRIARTGVLITAVAIIVLPTMRYNHQVHGRWMIADSSVFNLWIGLTDIEFADFRDDRGARALTEFQAAGPTFEARSEAFRGRIREIVESKGWPAIIANQLGKQYFRLLHYQTSLTTQLPGGPRSVYHFEAPALTEWIRAYAYAFHALILGAGVLGLVALRLFPIGWMLVMVAFVVYNAALCLAIHVKTRYLVQFLPMLALGAGITAHQVLDLLRGRGLSNTTVFVFTPRRIGIGLTCAAAVELIAFREAFLPPG